MQCKNCGANIEEKSKFCGYCGEKVEIENNIKNEIDTLSDEVDLDNTTKIELQQPSESSNQSDFINENNAQVDTTNQDINVNKEVGLKNDMPQKNTKKSNKLLFVIGGILLCVASIVFVIMTFMKSSNNPVAILEKAIYNLGIKSEKGLTIDSNLFFETPTGESFPFSITIKTEMKNEESGKLQMTLNKSLFFDEMNIYSTINKNEVILYTKSDIFDIVSVSPSITPVWLYYRMSLEKLTEPTDKLTVNGIELEDLIDKDHFKYVDEANGLKHYVLRVDQKLVDDAKEKLIMLQDESIKNMLNSIKKIEKNIDIDFYINSTNELSKIEINMTEYLTEENENISKSVFSIIFKDLNNTKVEIPNEALSSKVDFETYINENMMHNNMDLEGNNHFDSNTGLTDDFNLSFPNIQ